MSNDHDSYNVRQYIRMADLISSYESSDVTFDHFVNDLESLILSLEGISTEERNEIMSIWGIFEEILAVQIDSGSASMDNSVSQDISKALVYLKGKLAEKIH